MSEYRFNIQNGVLTSCMGGGSEVVIPPEVTSIGNMVFFAKSDIKSVVIHGGVKRIGQGAFFNCLNLETVVIGSGVEVIETFAFRGCSKLKAVSLPDSVKELQPMAFDDGINTRHADSAPTPDPKPETSIVEKTEKPRILPLTVDMEEIIDRVLDDRKFKGKSFGIILKEKRAGYRSDCTEWFSVGTDERVICDKIIGVKAYVLTDKGIHARKLNTNPDFLDWQTFLTATDIVSMKVNHYLRIETPSGKFMISLIPCAQYMNGSEHENLKELLKAVLNEAKNQPESKTEVMSSFAAALSIVASKQEEQFTNINENKAEPELTPKAESLTEVETVSVNESDADDETECVPAYEIDEDDEPVPAPLTRDESILRAAELLSEAFIILMKAQPEPWDEQKKRDVAQLLAVNTVKQLTESEKPQERKEEKQTEAPKAFDVEAFIDGLYPNHNNAPISLGLINKAMRGYYHVLKQDGMNISDEERILVHQVGKNGCVLTNEGIHVAECNQGMRKGGFLSWNSFFASKGVTKGWLNDIEFSWIIILSDVKYVKTRDTRKPNRDTEMRQLLTKIYDAYHNNK